MSTIDELLASGSGKGKSMKFPTIGTSYSGIVVSSEPRQAVDPETGQKKTWDDGNPMMQAVIGVQTDQRDPSIENDDGVRYDYVKLWGLQKQAFATAAAAAKAASGAASGSPAPGDFYSVTFVGEGEKAKPHHSAPKIFKYEIRKANALDAALGAASAVQQQPVAQAVAQQPVQQVAQQPVAQAVNVPQAALTPQQEAQVQILVSKSLSDEQIAAVIDGATPQAIAAVRLQAAAAGAGQGF